MFDDIITEKKKIIKNKKPITEKELGIDDKTLEQEWLKEGWDVYTNKKRKMRKGV